MRGFVLWELILIVLLFYVMRLWNLFYFGLNSSLLGVLFGLGMVVIVLVSIGEGML